MSLRAAPLFCSVIGLATYVSAPTFAQQTDQTEAATSSGLEEVVVTARRREEKAQTVPVSITAFSNDDLERQNIVGPVALNIVAPGILLAGNQYRVNNGASTNIWFRGVRGVLGYFAQTPISLNSSAQYFDLDNLQILKGPQGTLFGLSDDAGAILFEPKKPANNFEGYVSAGFGDYGHDELEGVLNVPIVSDKVLLRVGAKKEDTDGYLYDITQAKYVDDVHWWLGRASLTIRPTDNFQNDLIVNYWNSHNNNYEFDPRILAPNGLIAKLGGPTVAAWYKEVLQLNPYTVVGAPSTEGPTFERISQWNIIDTAAWDIDDNFTVKNIASYQQINSFAVGDIFGGPLGIDEPDVTLANGTHPQPQPGGPAVQYTEELQFLGKLLDDKLNFVVGTFNELSASRGPHPIGYATTFGAVAASNGAGLTARTNAVYGQGTMDLSEYVIEGLSFTAGYRYSWDKRYQEFAGYNPNTLVPIVNGTTANLGYFHAPSFTFSLDYQLDPQTMFYLTDSKGYSSGTFNTGAGLPVQYQLVQPESVNMLELGVKSDFQVAGMKSRADFAAYYGWHEGVQVLVQQGYTNTITGVAAFCACEENAGNGILRGLEGEFTILPIDSLTLNLGVAWEDPYYTKWTSGGVDLTYLPYAQAPEWKFVFHGTYHLPIDRALGDISINADFGYQTAKYSVEQYLTLGDKNDEYGNLNMSLNWTDVWGTPHLDGTIYVTNLTNNIHSDYGLPEYTQLGIAGYDVPPPRMWGMRLRYSFGKG